MVRARACVLAHTPVCGCWGEKFVHAVCVFVCCTCCLCIYERDTARDREREREVFVGKCACEPACEFFIFSMFLYMCRYRLIFWDARLYVCACVCVLKRRFYLCACCVFVSICTYEYLHPVYVCVCVCVCVSVLCVYVVGWVGVYVWVVRMCCACVY